MLAKSTKLALAIYSAYTLVYLGLVRSPGPPLVAAEAQTPALPDEAVLVELRVLPGDQRAIAGLGVGGRGQLWLLDWTRVDAWLGGRASLADLRLAAMPSSKMPQYVIEGEDGRLAMLVGEAEDPEGIQWIEWAPPAEPERSAMPADTAWVTPDGRAITTTSLDAELLERGLRPWPGLAGVGPNIAYTRINAAVSPEYEPYIRDDDLLIFAVDDGRLLAHFDTVPLAWVTSVSRLRGVVFATNEARQLEAALCDESGCEELLTSPYAGTDHGSFTSALDIAPELERAALCTDGGELMLYGWQVDELDGNLLLGHVNLADGCTKVVVVDAARVLVSSGERWLLVSFEPRGGWL